MKCEIPLQPAGICVGPRYGLREGRASKEMALGPSCYSGAPHVPQTGVNPKASSLPLLCG